MPMPFDQYRQRFGAQLHRLRADAKLTQREVAAGATITRQYLAQIECGQADPSLSKLYRLAEVLRRPLPELMDV